MGILTPIPVSMKLGELNNVFRRIIKAAERPHLSIPETEAGKHRKHYRQLVNRSLMFVSGIRNNIQSLKVVIECWNPLITNIVDYFLNSWSSRSRCWTCSIQSVLSSKKFIQLKKKILFTFFELNRVSYLLKTNSLLIQQYLIFNPNVNWCCTGWS